MAVSSRRPDMQHEDRVQNLNQFLSREDGDTGTLHLPDGEDVVFEVTKRETVAVAGQSMIRLTVKDVDSDRTFLFDSTRLHAIKVDWD